MAKTKRKRLDSICVVRIDDSLDRKIKSVIEMTQRDKSKIIREILEEKLSIF